MIKLDPLNGSVEVLVDDLDARPAAKQPASKTNAALGLNMFGTMRTVTSDAESGASFLGTLD